MHHFIRSIVIVCILSVLSSPVFANEVKLTKEASQEIVKNHTDKGFSGIVMVDRGRGEPQFLPSGFANKESQLHFNKDTIVDIASVSKQFIGAAILKLEVDGHLAVTDSLDKFIPNLEPHLANLTLHELLTHTAGISGMTGDDYQALNKDQLITSLNNTPLRYRKGLYNYSNLGYSLLAVVIEQVSGQSLDQYLKTKLFAPLGMHNTGYLISNEQEKQVATGYEGGFVWGKPHDKNWDVDGPYWNLRGNGGVLSTASDMQIWFRALLTHKILPQKSLEKLFGKHVHEGYRVESYYGYGWVTEILDDGSEMIAHNGSNGVFRADLRYYKKSDTIIFAVGNDSAHAPWRLVNDLHKIILSK